MENKTRHRENGTVAQEAETFVLCAGLALFLLLVRTVPMLAVGNTGIASDGRRAEILSPCPPFMFQERECLL